MALCGKAGPAETGPATSAIPQTRPKIVDFITLPPHMVESAGRIPGRDCRVSSSKGRTNRSRLLTSSARLRITGYDATHRARRHLPRPLWRGHDACWQPRNRGVANGAEEHGGHRRAAGAGAGCRRAIGVRDARAAAATSPPVPAVGVGSAPDRSGAAGQYPVPQPVSGARRVPGSTSGNRPQSWILRRQLVFRRIRRSRRLLGCGR